MNKIFGIFVYFKDGKTISFGHIELKSLCFTKDCARTVVEQC